MELIVRIHKRDYNAQQKAEIVFFAVRRKFDMADRGLSRDSNGTLLFYHTELSKVAQLVRFIKKVEGNPMSMNKKIDENLK